MCYVNRYVGVREFYCPTCGSNDIRDKGLYNYPSKQHNESLSVVLLLIFVSDDDLFGLHSIYDDRLAIVGQLVEVHSIVSGIHDVVVDGRRQTNGGDTSSRRRRD